MPTMILALACFLAPATHAAPAMDGPLVVALAVLPHGQPAWVGRSVLDLDGLGWLLDESETDDDRDNDDSLAHAEILAWANSPAPFGVPVANPHRTILPRSALRSLILRC